MNTCDCGLPAVLVVTATDAAGYILDTSYLCAACATHRTVQRALETLDLAVGEIGG